MSSPRNGNQLTKLQGTPSAGGIALPSATTSARASSASTPLGALYPPSVPSSAPSFSTDGSVQIVMVNPLRAEKDSNRSKQDRGFQASNGPPQPGSDSKAQAKAVVLRDLQDLDSDDDLEELEKRLGAMSIDELKALQRQECAMLFSDRQIRLGFARKVFGILLSQLLFTTACVLTFILVKPIKEYVIDHTWMLWSALLFGLLVVLVLICLGDIRRWYPYNMIALGLFTLAESFLLGALSSYFETMGVVYALLSTAVVSLSLVVFACKSDRDYSKWAGFLIVGCAVLLMFASVNIVAQNQWGSSAFGAFGATLFGCFIVWDTSMIVEVKHRKFAIAPEEYVFAALNLYLDIAGLFMYLLLLVAGKGSEST